MKSNRKFTKNSAGFTGLEAAIVLIAFVVVAAVFSYVMLGAGFFTSQKSKEVVHTGVDQATASLQIAGDTIGLGDATDAKLDGAIVTLSLTAGNNPVDMTKMVVSYTTASYYEDNIYSGMPSTAMALTSDVHNDGTPTTDGGYQFVVAGNGDNMLDKNEKVQLNLPFPTNVGNGAADLVRNDVANTPYTGEQRVGANEKVTLDIKPATGANLQITFTVPPTIDSYMVLL
ncbi:archaellin/type IV pilin N-terminal domain-containing protein [Methanocella sp. MCL-LM]|uniref:archaellin/type IV pilin N-terminal domain-containing protein n=1 Tax=Methanocella sp. MCL-LM TaxID=3412035 RepID=UPI003C73CE96